MKEYSFKKGLSKGLIAVLTGATMLVAFAGFSDITVWDLVVTYVKPVLGTLTVGGVLGVVTNFVRFHYSEE